MIMIPRDRGFIRFDGPLINNWRTITYTCEFKVFYSIHERVSALNRLAQLQLIFAGKTGAPKATNAALTAAATAAGLVRLAAHHDTTIVPLDTAEASYELWSDADKLPYTLWRPHPDRSMFIEDGGIGFEAGSDIWSNIGTPKALFFVLGKVPSR